LPHQQHFDFGVQKFVTRRIALAERLRADSGAMAEQTRRNHARVVHDHQLIAAQDFRQVTKLPVFPRAARAVEQQQTRCVAFGQRALRDTLRGQLVIEFADIHRCLPSMLSRPARKRAR
jgi:hypothetical protein